MSVDNLVELSACLLKLAARVVQATELLSSCNQNLVSFL